MKIAILVDAALRPKIMSDKTLAALRALGEVSLNLTGAASVETVRELIRDADVAITSWGCPALTADILDCAPALKLVLHAAGSVKSVVSEEMFARGIRIISCACVLSYGVSETALGFTIAAAKNFFALNQDIQQGNWRHDGIMELFDITVGVVGFGFAGRHYIELLQAFEVEVLCYDPFVDAQTMAAAGAKKADLPEVFSRSDILSLHAPSIDATYRMVNRDTLASMKQGAVLINTARGSLIDEEALAEALRAGKLKYACLDVTDPEPPAADSPLRSLPNCIMTPHLAGLANNGLRKIGAHCERELRRFLNGEALQSEVTQAMLESIA